MTSARRKVTVVGAGNVGATCAQVIATRDYAGVVLGYEPNIVGSNGYEETAGSEVVVITAGVPRTGDMSRDDLVTTNEKIVGSVTEAIVAQNPGSVLIV